MPRSRIIGNKVVDLRRPGGALARIVHHSPQRIWRADMTRRRSLAAGVMALLSLAAISSGAAEAQTHAASHAHQHGALLTKIRAAVIKVIGTQGDRVEIAATGNILIVARINSTMNQTGHDARDSEASRIAPVVASAIAEQPEFNNIHTIRVLYVNRARPGTHGRIIDTVDFRQDPSGAFVFHAR
jgi:hypothetical protein